MSHCFGSQTTQIKACTHVTPFSASILMWPLALSIYLLSSCKDTNPTGFRVQPTLVWAHLNWLHPQRHLFLNKFAFTYAREHLFSENNSTYRNVLTGLILHRNYTLEVYLQGNQMSVDPSKYFPNCLLHFTSHVFPRSNITHKISPLSWNLTHTRIFF